ncbi:MAG: helix-turn-helix transcriptional regulator, partial [Bacilli bacterium]|nr:helix-turn-helix transcriptional regulator [Bacilli bacterium]
LKTEARMNFSANELIYTDIKISELYEYVGYSTPEHFSYAFKKYFNMSPNEYRKVNKKHQINTITGG